MVFSPTAKASRTAVFPNLAPGARLYGHIGLAPERRQIATLHDGVRGVDRWKRALDVALGITALALCAPLIGAVAVLIKLTSRGPVLIKQERVGLNRRVEDRRRFQHNSLALERRNGAWAELSMRTPSTMTQHPLVADPISPADLGSPS